MSKNQDGDLFIVAATPGGRKVPLPYHGKEIARVTAQSILKDLGVSGRLDDFMNL